MAVNPRDTTDFKGIGYRGATYHIDGSTITFDQTKRGGSAQAGKLVAFTADGNVKLTADGDSVLGMLYDVKADGFCTVQIEGGAEIEMEADWVGTEGDRLIGGANGLGASATAPAGRHTIMKVVSGTTVQVFFGL